jgi:hypothetical protein
MASPKLAPSAACALLLALAAALASGRGSGGSFAEAFATIEAKEALEHVEVLASERFEGRGTPSEGLSAAANYIAERFASFGLDPGGDDGTFLHAFEIDALVPQEGNQLTMTTSEGERRFEEGTDWVAIAGGDGSEVRGEVVFAGYAVEAQKYRYSDFANLDVRGKLVLALTHEPREKAKGAAFDGPAPTKHSSIFEKARTVAEKGGRALLLVRDPANHEATTAFRFARPPGRRNRGAPETEDSIPIVGVSLATAEAILGQEIRPLQEKIDRTVRPPSTRATGSTVALRAATKTGSATVHNVVGIRRGEDSQLASEAVLLGAHYDHVGVDDKGEIYFGADDNASGTAALLETAEAFSQTSTRRSVIFCAFAGEERGLLGSDAFATRPSHPLEKIVMMVNTDMVGRGPVGEMSIGGAWDNPPVAAAIQRALKLRAPRLKIETKGGQQYWQRSDQWSFYRRGVPALFVTELGTEHEDYHRPTDTSDKIDAEKIARAARLLFNLAFLFADEEETLPRPEPETR